MTTRRFKVEIKYWQFKDLKLPDRCCPAGSSSCRRSPPSAWPSSGSAWPWFGIGPWARPGLVLANPAKMFSVVKVLKYLWKEFSYFTACLSVVNSSDLLSQSWKKICPVVKVMKRVKLFLMRLVSLKLNCQLKTARTCSRKSY